MRWLGQQRRYVTRLLPALLVFALIAAACSDDDTSGSTQATTATTTATTQPPAPTTTQPPATTTQGVVFEAGALGAVEVGSGDAIEIRALQAISGDVAFLGIDQVRGIELAIEDFGEVLGHSINLGTPEDDLCSAEGGQSGAQAILAQDGVIGVIGTTCSGAAAAAVGPLTDAGLVLVSGSNTSPSLTSDLEGTAGVNWREGYFRTAHNDLFQGGTAARFAFENLGLTRAAAIHDGDPYTQGLASAFANEFSALGGEMVVFTAVNKGDTDMTTVLTEVAAEEPQVVYFPIFQPEGDFIIQQRRGVVGLSGVVWFGADGLLVDSFMELPESAGMFFSGPDLRFGTNASVTGTNYAQLVSRYEAAYGVLPPAAFHAHAYDATILLLSAIEAAAFDAGDGTLFIDRQGVRDALYATRNFAGVIGTLSCDAFGDCGSQSISVVQHTDPADVQASKANVVYSFVPSGGGGAEAPVIDPGEVAVAPNRVQDNETVVVAWPGFYNSLDPPDSLVTHNREMSAALYDRLLTYRLVQDADGSFVWTGSAGDDVAPGLAESWTIDGPGLVTFKIREGVVFNKTGNPVTANDIKYTFVRSIVVPGYGAFNANLAGLFEPERQITVIDDRTVQFQYELGDGTPFLLTASLPSMRFPIFGIVDSVEVAARGTEDDPFGHEWLVDNPEGSGPYTIASVTPGTEVILQRVANHWTEGPNNQVGQAYNGFDRVIYRVLNNPADITALMLRGEVDVTFALGLQNLNALRDAGFTIVNAEIPDVWRMDIPVDVPPFDNVLVRQALAYAIPYDILVDNVFANATRAYSVINPASPSFIRATEMYDTNLETARALLTQAGLPDGFETDIYYDSGRVEWEDIALFLQASFREIGIELNLRPLPTTEFGTQTTARLNNEEGVMEGLQMRSGVIWLDDADPNVGVWLATRGFPGPRGVGGFSNATHYSNDEVDRLHFENRFNPDLNARAEAYREVQRITAIDLPIIPILVRGLPGAIHPTIEGVTFTADPHLRSYMLRFVGE